MPAIVYLAAGDHDLAETIVDWKAGEIRGGPSPLVGLIASIETHPLAGIRPSRGSTATTLAIQMDQKAASWLYEQLGVLGRSMGWLPQQ
jgi:hypothetical protein